MATGGPVALVRIMAALIASSAFLLHIPLAAPDPVQCNLQPSTPVPGDHQYFVCPLSRNEATLAASNRLFGRAFAFPQPTSVAQIWRTTDLGASWEAIPLPLENVCLSPPELALLEGDVFVNPSGNVFVMANGLSDALVRIWKSTDGGITFRCLSALSLTRPPVVLPDRTFAVSSSGALSEVAAGESPPPGLLGRIMWASITLDNELGSQWYVPDPHVHVTIPGPIPLGAAAYLNTAKPMAQGYSSGTQLVPLSDGALYSPYDIAWTTDAIVWNRPANYQTFPPFAALPATPIPTGILPFPLGTVEHGYAMWDASSEGILYAVRQHNTTSGWEVEYKWYNGTWHDGLTIPLASEPRWGGAEASANSAAVKSFGSQLAILTRDGNADTLIRIDNAATISPTWDKDVLGTAPEGSAARFPNLVFDREGRAIAFYQDRVAYALTP